MGWGTNFTTDLYLNRIMFNYLWEVDKKIEDNTASIKTLFNKIRMYSIATPSDIVSSEWKDDIIGWINTEINGIEEELSSLYIENFILNKYKEFIIDKCNGVIPKAEL